MKTKFVLPLIFGALFLVSAFGVHAQAQTGYTGPAFDSTNYPDFAPNVPYDSCASQNDTSGVQYTLALAEGTADDVVKFNTTTLVAPKDSCVAIVIQNLSPDMVHDLVIEGVNGTAGINHLDMDVDNSTANVGWGAGYNVFFIHTPNVDAQFTYFCEQPGHRTQGMEGTLYVGKGPSSAPGFDAVTGLVAIIATVGAVSFYRKRN